MPIDRTRYDFNGKTGLTKKALIFEVVKKYISDSNNNKTLDELKKIFSEKSDFHIDMFVKENTYQNLNTDRRKRYFKDPFQLKNGAKLYLSTQWGGDIFKQLLGKIRNDLNFDIHEHKKVVASKNLNKSSEISPIKNIILYGPPGVGKTYNHKKVVSLIENRQYSQKELFKSIIQNRSEEDIDSIFDTIKNEGRVEFITFHQSFSYEDFIEGYRPNEDGKIELENGIFKEVSDKARKNLSNSQKSFAVISKELNFKELLDSFVESIEKDIDKHEKYPLSESIYIFEIENDAFRYKGDNWMRHSAGIRMRFDVLEEMYIHNVRSRQDIKRLESLGGLAKQHATYFWALLEKLYAFKEKHFINQKEDYQVEKKVEAKNYYLIIDEINRGNISKIFGELITLIEEDKRDSIEVTLPYSKESFKVPGNLYIIATMNSTDKSIALIDIALRRRFTFLKMQPNVELVKDEAKGLFTELNNFISEKLGSDFQIGHSYFMDYDDLDFVLDYKIVPLLEEYFFADPISLKEAKIIIGKGEQ